MSATTTDISKENQSLRDILQVRSPGEVVDYINFLPYGDPGVGKTFLAGTAEDHADTSPVLYLDVDGGVTTLRHRPTLDVVPIRSIQPVPGGPPCLNDIYETLHKSIYTDTKGIARLRHYKTVVIDRLDELSDLDMRFIMTAAYNRNPDKVDIDVPSPREYGINRSHMRKLVRAFRDLPCHVIFVCGVAAKSEDGQPTKYFPGFTGKLQTEIAGFCDIVGYYYNDNTTGEVVRKIQFQGTRRVQAKDRTGTLGEIMENPTIPMMWNLINSQTPVAKSVAKKAA